MDGESRRIFLRAGGFNQRIEPLSTPNLRSPTHEASASRSLEVLKLLFTFWGGRGNNTIGRKAEWRPVSVTVRQDSLRCRKILGTERQSQPWTALTSPGRSRARRCGTRPASGQDSAGRPPRVSRRRPPERATSLARRPSTTYRTNPFELRCRSPCRLCRRARKIRGFRASIRRLFDLLISGLQTGELG